MGNEISETTTTAIAPGASSTSNLKTIAPSVQAAKADQFKRAPVRRNSDHHESLLTMALQSQSEEEAVEDSTADRSSQRRRSVASNVSLASTAELTCSTGITTPARTSSPSPRRTYVGCIPVAHAKALAKIDGHPALSPQGNSLNNAPDAAKQPLVVEPQKQPAEKKRCITFACAAKPVPAPAPKPIDTARTKDGKPEAAKADAPKRPCIKFAGLDKTTAGRLTPPKQQGKLGLQRSKSPMPDKDSSPTALRKQRSPSSGKARYRSSTPRRSIPSPVLVRSKKYLTANVKDLQSESSRFHEFASDTPQEDDWIRQDTPLTKQKITINDTLEKENKIRKLAKEAEEEAEMEEEENEENETPNGDDGENLDEVDENDDEEGKNDLGDDFSGYGSDDDFTDGYNSDNEGGFAESDGEDEDDGLRLWTLSHPSAVQFSEATPVYRQPSFGTSHSDSSGQHHLHPSRAKKQSLRQLTGRVVTPELPDSTDFVCGTLDEDRPLEEAYVSRIAARKRENMRTIPQDIDPSFPTSDPEDDEDGIQGTTGGQDNEEDVWLHGEMEDLHHGQEAVDRRKKKGDKAISPKRYHSPPPKRRHSPAPHARGRSPVRLFGQSLKRFQSPVAMHPLRSPPASPAHVGQHPVLKTLAFRPGLTHTKSLPRTPVVAPLIKCRRARTGTMTKEKHVRGAVDIVLGLEQKRQRRKEKFYQKHCNRARKGQVVEKRPLPGQGAERMKELGLLMAGKLQGNYVLSV